MKRLIALCGALALTLALAAPAAANDKVKIEEFSGSDQFEIVVDPSTCSGPPDWEGWCEPWQCSEPIYYGGTWNGDLWLWYPKGVDTTDPDEYMPDGEAWPWTKGLGQNSGIDYFSSGPGKTGKVVSGKYGFSVHMSNHHLGGDPDYAADPESWTEMMSGKTWGITAPGKGPIFFEAGNYRYKLSISDMTPGAEWGFEELRPWKGKSTFDAEGLCEYFGYDYVEP